MNTNVSTTCLGRRIKPTGFIVIVFLILFSVPNVYAQYCNNPTDVTFYRNGTTATLTWDDVAPHYYWIILDISPWGSTNWFENKSDPHVIHEGGSTSSNSASVTGLPATGTLYAYVVGVDSGDPAWPWCAPDATDAGGQSQPPPDPPTVTTSAASSVTSSSATLGGNVTSEGGASVSERGVVYSTTDATPQIGEGGVIKNSNGSGTGAFSESIGGLTTGATYYFQAYATNIGGTSYGGVEQFSTNQPPVANNDTYTRFYTNTAVSFSIAANGVLGNDTDPDGNPLTVGTPRPASNVSHGTLTLNSNGSFTYTSTNGFREGSDSFTYYANDGTVNSNSTATVTINVVTPRFVGPGTDFNDPNNWNTGYVPDVESLDIIIAAGQSINFNQSYTCKNLTFESATSSFTCTPPNKLTITGDVYDGNGNIKIAVSSSLVVSSSIQIQQSLASPTSPPEQ